MLIEKIWITNTAALICVLHFTAVHVKAEYIVTTLDIQVMFNQQQNIMLYKFINHVSLKSTFFMSTAPLSAPRRCLNTSLNLKVPCGVLEPIPSLHSDCFFPHLLMTLASL